MTAVVCHPEHAAAGSVVGSRVVERAIDTVLFDIGDTLIHFEQVGAPRVLDSVLRYAYLRMEMAGLKLPKYRAYRRVVRRRIVLSLAWSRICKREMLLMRTVHRALRELGLRVAWDQVEDTLEEALKAIHPYVYIQPDSLGVLERLRDAGIRMGVVSNTVFPGSTVDYALREGGLYDFFPVRIYSSDVRFMKPDPRIFIIALRELDAIPEHTLFVGDRMDNDVFGANRVGMQTALYSRTGKVRRGRVRPDHVVRGLGDIPALLNL